MLDVSQIVPFVRGILGEQPSCAGCPLAGQRIVPPEGNPWARIALVGEGPGVDEVRVGRPFVGASGEALNHILAAIGLPRDWCWVSNTTMCLPRAVRIDGGEGRVVHVSPNDAKRMAMKFCQRRFITEMQALGQTLNMIVPIGALAYESLVGVAHKILARRGAVAWVDLDARAKAATEGLTHVARTPQVRTGKAKKSKKSKKPKSPAETPAA